MAKVTDKQIADILRKAKNHLNDGLWGVPGRKTYICFAISVADQYRESRAAKAAQKMIHSRIKGHGTVDAWLWAVAKIPKRQMTRRNVQAYRHRWLDALIAEFSK
jgi:hypothetical protein